MAEVRSNHGMITNKRTLDGDIEAGSITGLNSDMKVEASKCVGSSDKVTNVGCGDGQIVNKWVISLGKILEEIPQYMCSTGHPGRIARIPGNLRDIDAKAYEPYFVSFGPYHNGKPRVHQMEKRKLAVLKCLLETRPDLTLKDYFKEINNIEPEARRFYSNIQMEKEKIVQILLLDSLFILTVFCGIAKNHNHTNRRNYRTWGIDTNEGVNEKNESLGMGVDSDSMHIIATTESTEDELLNEEHNVDIPRWSWTYFLHDLFLLENQLPFFVLEKMHVFVYGGLETQLRDIMKDRLGHLLPENTQIDANKVISASEDVHHLLHLCHMFFRPTLLQGSTTPQLPDSSQMFRLGSAVQLYEEGVSFETRSRSTRHSLLDITFSSTGEMVMPCLAVDDITDSLLRNLIALEQMKYPAVGLNVSAYVVLLLHLVTTPEDVVLLRRKGIIQHHLASDKEMVYLINRLSVGLSFDYVQDNYSLKSVFWELKRYTERRVPRWKAWLRHRYCINPWTMISLLVASLLLLLTFVQTYYAVYSYYHPYFDGHR